MSVAAHSNQRMYVLALRNNLGVPCTFWLPTIATNRHECWENARRIMKGESIAAKRAELKAEGFVCVPVRMRVELFPAPKFTS